MTQELVGFAREYGVVGAVLLALLSSLGYVAKIGIAHLISNIKARREERDNEIKYLKRRLNELDLRHATETLTCREDLLIDAQMFSSAIGLATRFQSIVDQATGGGKRTVPQELHEARRDLAALRARRHDIVNERAVRLHAARLELESIMRSQRSAYA